MDKINSQKKNSKTHIIKGKVVTNELWTGNDGQIYSFYDFGSSINNKTYMMPSTIFAKINTYENIVKIEDFVVRDSNQGIGHVILNDFILFCTTQKFDEIAISISPVDQINRLVEFYTKFGFNEFSEENGFIQGKLKLNKEFH